MKTILIFCLLTLAACSAPADGFVGVQSVRSPLYEPAEICKRFYLGERCRR